MAAAPARPAVAPRQEAGELDAVMARIAALDIARGEADAHRRALEAHVAALAARVVGIEARLATLEARDLVEDVAFVAAIASAVGARAFSAAELHAHAVVDAGLARVLRPLTAIQTGRRLRAVMGRACGGWMVQRIGRDADGVIWHVVPMRLHAEACADTLRDTE